MPNIASVLKDEILRLARKEVRRELEGLKKASAQYRSDIAALKRQVIALASKPWPFCLRRTQTRSREVFQGSEAALETPTE